MKKWKKTATKRDAEDAHEKVVLTEYIVKSSRDLFLVICMAPVVYSPEHIILPMDKGICQFNSKRMQYFTAQYFKQQHLYFNNSTQRDAEKPEI